MTLPAGFLTKLTAGFAQELASKTALGLTWQPTGKYAADTTGIFDSAMPPTPDRLVTLTPYPLSDDPSLQQSIVGMQIRTRGATADPREVRDLDDAIADELLGLYPLTLPNGIRITTLQRTSSASLGQEEGGSRRWGRSSNYQLGLYRPSIHRV